MGYGTEITARTPENISDYRLFPLAYQNKSYAELENIGKNYIAVVWTHMN